MGARVGVKGHGGTGKYLLVSLSLSRLRVISVRVLPVARVWGFRAHFRADCGMERYTALELGRVQTQQVPQKTQTRHLHPGEIDIPGEIVILPCSTLPRSTFVHSANT